MLQPAWRMTSADRSALRAGAAGEIERAKALLESGTINQQEFDAIKAKAIA